MVRAGRSIAALVAVALLWTGSAAYAQEPAGTSRSRGRPLAAALADLQKRGLKIIYSSQVVRPDMRVPTEPRATSLRRVLDELLSPHGLIAQDGPGGTVLVVKNPRARINKPEPREVPLAPPVATIPAGVDAGGAPRFEATVEVTEVEPGGAAIGPPGFGVRPLEVSALAGGFENIFRTLQSLPGVTGTDELGSRIAVRGGSPDQNLTIMDGVEIHNPYRLIFASEDLALVGLASTFNPETIESFEFIPGAFDVRHGDRLSSLLVVRNREGSESEAIQGSAFAGIADANGILEGRLPRRAAGSWLVSARRSHLNLVAERALVATLPSFQDLHARLSWRPRPRQRVAIVGLAARERTRLLDSAASDAGNVTRTRNDLLAVTFESSVGAGGSSRQLRRFPNWVTPSAPTSARSTTAAAQTPPTALPLAVCSSSRSPATLRFVTSRSGRSSSSSPRPGTGSTPARKRTGSTRAGRGGSQELAVNTKPTARASASARACPAPSIRR